MHKLKASYDRIHWAGRDAERTSDAAGLVNHGQGEGFLLSALWIDREGSLAGDLGQSLHADKTTRGATINECLLTGESLRVWSAP